MLSTGLHFASESTEYFFSALSLAFAAPGREPVVEAMEAQDCSRGKL
jgi:hypothetical protein